MLEQVSRKDVNNNLIIYTSRPTLDFSYVYLYGCPMKDVKKTEQEQDALNSTRIPFLISLTAKNVAYVTGFKHEN